MNKRTTISLPILLMTTVILLILMGRIGADLVSTTIVVLVGTLLSNIMVQSSTSFWIARECFLSASMIELARAIFANGVGAVAAIMTHDLFAFVVARFASDLMFALATVAFTAGSNELWSAYRRGEVDAALTAFGIRMFWANCAFVARTEGVSFIVAGQFGVEAVGIFRLAYSNIYYRMQNQLSNITDLVYAKNARERHKVEFKMRMKQYLILAALGAAVSVFGVAASYIYIYSATPKEYHGAFACVVILILALPLDVVYSYVNQLFLVRYNHQSVTRLLVFHSLLQLAMLLLFTKLFGLWGACASVSAALGIALIVGVVLERRQELGRA